MKGQTGIELAIIAVMGLIGIVTLMTPPLLLKATSLINIEYQYNYDNTALLLMSTLSATVPDSLIGNTMKSSLELLGEYIQLQNRPDKKPIEDKLALLAKESLIDCYKLSAGTDVVAKSQCDASRYTYSTNIPLPYKPDNLVKTITMVVGK